MVQWPPPVLGSYDAAAAGVVAGRVGGLAARRRRRAQGLLGLADDVVLNAALQLGVPLVPGRAQVGGDAGVRAHGDLGIQGAPLGLGAGLLLLGELGLAALGEALAQGQLVR